MCDKVYAIENNFDSHKDEKKKSYRIIGFFCSRSFWCDNVLSNTETDVTEVNPKKKIQRKKSYEGYDLHMISQVYCHMLKPIIV